MSINFRKGPRIINPGGVLVPALPYRVAIDSTSEEVPDLHRVIVPGLGSPSRIPHQVIASCYASRINVDINIGAGDINYSVNTTLHAGRIRILTDEQDEYGGDFFTSIHDMFGGGDQFGGSTNTQLVYEVSQGGSKLGFSILMNTFADTEAGRYFSIPDAWRISFALAGLLTSYDDDELILDQWGVGYGGDSSAVNLDVFGVPFSGISEASISGAITVEAWIGDGT
jgi:hypothetical protein